MYLGAPPGQAGLRDLIRGVQDSAAQIRGGPDIYIYIHIYICDCEAIGGNRISDRWEVALVFSHAGRAKRDTGYMYVHIYIYMQ